MKITINLEEKGFPGHKGRPGQVGGSMPKGGGAGAGPASTPKGKGKDVIESDYGEPGTPYHGGGVGRGSGRKEATETFANMGAKRLRVEKVYWQDGMWRMDAFLPAQGNSKTAIAANLRANGFKHKVVKSSYDGSIYDYYTKEPAKGSKDYYPRTHIAIYREGGGTGGGQEFGYAVSAYLQLTG